MRIRQLFFVMALWSATVPASAQDPCPEVPNRGTETITPHVSKGGQACAPGSYVRTGTSYDADFFTDVAGSCEIYNYDPYLGCMFYDVQFRGVGASTVSEVSAPGWTSVYPNPNNYPPQLDTRQSGTSTPDTPKWYFNYEGERTLRFRSNISLTQCEIMPDYVATEAQFTVVKCVPRWLLTDDQQHLVHNIESQSPAIIVRAPTTMNVRMKTGLQNAVAAWNTALEAYGVDVGPRYQYVENDTPCSGQYCINTEIGEIDLGTECAEGTLTVDPSTGLILGSTITFPDDTAGWPQAFNTRLAAHELGHHLGLENNNSSCGTAYSLMKPVSCGASSGFPTAPTMSDHLPVARSAYMGQTRATCQ